MVRFFVDDAFSMEVLHEKDGGRCLDFFDPLLLC